MHASGVPGHLTFLGLAHDAETERLQRELAEKEDALARDQGRPAVWLGENVSPTASVAGSSRPRRKSSDRISDGWRRRSLGDMPGVEPIGRLERSLQKRSSRDRRRRFIGSSAGSVSGQGVNETDLAQLVHDLKDALAKSERRRRDAQDRWKTAESNAQDIERGLERELHEARDALHSARTRLQWRPTELLWSEIRSIEAQRGVVLRDCEVMKVQLEELEAKGPLHRLTDGTASSTDLAALSNRDAMEAMLRAEANALQTTLRLYSRHREDEARAKQRKKENQEEQALWAMRQRQFEEFAALEDAEARLQVARAAMADALSVSQQPDDSTELLDERMAYVVAKEASCQELRETLDPLRTECHEFLKLHRAMEARTAMVEQHLLSQMRISTDQALAHLQYTQYRGVAALIFVLVLRFGSPQLAFRALDQNCSGRLATHEFDNSLRLGLNIDYESITGMKLRPLFREFDRRHRGLLTEEDFAACCAEVWQTHARDPSRDYMLGTLKLSEPLTVGTVLEVVIVGLRGNCNRNQSAQYCTCEVQGRPHTRVRTPAVDPRSPNWNHKINFAHWRVDEALIFQICDVFSSGRPDELVCRTLLDPAEVWPESFNGELHIPDPRNRGEDLWLRITATRVA